MACSSMLASAPGPLTFGGPGLSKFELPITASFDLEEDYRRVAS